MADYDACSARTFACRVHTRVNACKFVKRCSQECEHSTLGSVRHVNYEVR